ncbi:hypothetical protein IQ230_09680 [Gloeocapsopsis crepidinum LEGE 06123]|uniref:Uncharacterized protein n=1 Tax=Gloeocapsopsis crepidinum LEGE 06123 TaxID=588587 RepID=A0ABR9UQU0_9CHRO|nr:hypothetical protein [Gloeocapsopsis crepidinum]MBE9190626.1 hypothetical protein [Gloeocapsopsis crepidinum LEGE 06123]
MFYSTCHTTKSSSQEVIKKEKLVENPVEDITFTPEQQEETVINHAKGDEAKFLLNTYYGNSENPFYLSNGRFYWWSDASSTSYCGNVQHSTSFDNMKSFTSAGVCPDNYTKYTIITYRPI